MQEKNLLWFNGITKFFFKCEISRNYVLPCVILRLFNWCHNGTWWNVIMLVFITLAVEVYLPVGLSWDRVCFVKFVTVQLISYPRPQLLKPFEEFCCIRRKILEFTEVNGPWARFKETKYCTAFIFLKIQKNCRKIYLFALFVLLRLDNLIFENKKNKKLR